MPFQLPLRLAKATERETQGLSLSDLFQRICVAADCGDSVSSMLGCDRQKREAEPVVPHSPIAARFFTIFLDGFVGTVKEKMIDVLLAVLVLVYQHFTHQLSIEAWRTNAWAAATPWVWLACVIAIIHILRSAVVLAREMSDQSPLIEIPGRSRTVYPPQTGHYRAKIWGGSAFAILILLIFSYLVYSYGRLQSAQSPSAGKLPPPPPPPTISGVTVGTEVQPNYPGKKLVASQAITPCTLKHRKLYSLDELGSLPGGQDLKRPWLVAKPLRVLIEERHILADPSLSTPPGSDDLMFEISVTSRGEPTVAKDWVLCLVQQGKPRYYKPYEIPSSDLALFGNKVWLEQVTAAAPIERGNLVVGWISFRVPKVASQEGLIGSIEYRDYLEKRYSTGFMLAGVANQ